MDNQFDPRVGHGGGSASGIGGGVNAARELQYPRAISSLHEEIELSAKLAEQLEIRLMPLLMPSPPPPGNEAKGSAPSTPKAPIVETVDALARHMRTTNNYLQSLLGRLEI